MKFLLRLLKAIRFLNTKKTHHPYEWLNTLYKEHELFFDNYGNPCSR